MRVICEASFAIIYIECVQAFLWSLTGCLYLIWLNEQHTYYTVWVCHLTENIHVIETFGRPTETTHVLKHKYFLSIPLLICVCACVRFLLITDICVYVHINHNPQHYNVHSAAMPFQLWSASSGKRLPARKLTHSHTHIAPYSVCFILRMILWCFKLVHINSTCTVLPYCHE